MSSMGPKKGGKGGGKAKKEPEKEEESEYDTMDLEMLREVVPMLRQQLDKAMLDRNYVQLERDSIQQFFDITHRDVTELELAVSAKEREMEMLEDNHRVELRVYQQLSRWRRCTRRSHRRHRPVVFHHDACCHLPCKCYKRTDKF